MSRLSTDPNQPGRLGILLLVLTLLTATLAGILPTPAQADAVGGGEISGTILHFSADFDPLDPLAIGPAGWGATFTLQGLVHVNGQLVEVHERVWSHADFGGSGQESVLGGSGIVKWQFWSPISSTEGAYSRKGDTILVDIDAPLSGETSTGQHVSFQASLTMTMESALLGFGGVCGFTCATPFVGEWHVTEVVNDLT